MYQYNIVSIYSIKNIIATASILNRCGKDMAQNYNLHHWDNSMMKSLVITFLGLLKNKVYIVKKGNNAVATFQTKLKKDTLFFEKLAVDPSVSGSGIGSYCMDCIEAMAKQYGKQRVKMEVYDKSQHAIDFYTHKGYRQAGKTSTLKYTDIIMEKTL